MYKKTGTFTAKQKQQRQRREEVAGRKRTERYRLVRGPRSACCEYISEPRTERKPVGCDGRTSVIRVRVLPDGLYLLRQEARAFCEFRW